MAQTSPPQGSDNRPQTLPKNTRLVLCPAGRLVSFVTYIFACRPQHEVRVMCCLCNRLSRVCADLRLCTFLRMLFSARALYTYVCLYN